MGKEFRKSLERFKQAHMWDGQQDMETILQNLQDGSEAIWKDAPRIYFNPEKTLYAIPDFNEPDKGYQTLKLFSEGMNVFPFDDYEEYMLADIEQCVYVYRGTVIARVDGLSRAIGERETLVIKKGSWVRMIYGDGAFQFHQKPHIARGVDFKLR